MSRKPALSVAEGNLRLFFAIAQHALKDRVGSPSLLSSRAERRTSFLDFLRKGETQLRSPGSERGSRGAPPPDITNRADR
jgi:hypothetical protein